MEIYSVIREALDQMYLTLAQQNPECDQGIWDAIGFLTQRYDNLNDGGPIEYDGMSAQYAYLYKYAGSRACAVYSRLNPSRRIAEIFEGGAAIVTSLGAGPGSDMLGVLKYRGAHYPQANITVNLVDGVGPWLETARVVRQRLRNHLEGANDPEVRFNTINLASANIEELLALYQNTSLFTLSYVLSELPFNDAARLLDAVISLACPGTVFLVIDNNIQPVANLLERITNNPAMRGVGVREGEITLLHEDMNNLGPHLERFNNYARGGHPNIVLRNARWLLSTKV